MRRLCVLLSCWAAGLLSPASAQQQPPRELTVAEKLQPYIGCINRLSERTFTSRERYNSWVGKNGPTGKERIVYGLYTIYDPKDCRDKVALVEGVAPSLPELEKAGADFVAAVTAIEPLLREADDYYEQKNYLDDKMAKGRALHPRLVAAWDAFGKADRALRENVQRLNDKVQEDQLADIERREGRKMRWNVLTVMAKAKALQRVEYTGEAKMDLATVTPALDAFEAAVRDLEKYAADNPQEKVGSFFTGAAKGYLVSAKSLMRRVRDKTPYSSGDRMMLSSQGGGWMVEGSPQRLLKDYNSLIDAYNRGPAI